MHRQQILENAIKHTVGDRDAEYGSPETNLSHIADFWTAYLTNKLGHDVYITAEDVAWLNTLQKIARTFSGKVRADTYEDAAAYSAIAGEIATKKTEVASGWPMASGGKPA